MSRTSKYNENEEKYRINGKSLFKYKIQYYTQFKYKIQQYTHQNVHLSSPVKRINGQVQTDSC